jgi:hypothetical protein
LGKGYCLFSSSASQKPVQKLLDGEETFSSLPSGNSKINTTDMRELQCGCTIDDIDGILLVECIPHKEGKFRD